MSDNIPPPANGKDEMYGVMQKLYDDSQVVKSAHFIASQRKKRNAKLLGGAVIVLNVLIGSGLIEAAFKDQGRITTAIKALSFLAAALAGLQTYLNLQKEVECHTNSGDVYASINRRLSVVMAEYRGQPTNRAATTNDFKALNTEFLKANDDSKACIPSDADYAKARAGIAGRRGKKRVPGEA